MAAYEAGILDSYQISAEDEVAIGTQWSPPDEEVELAVGNVGGVYVEFDVVTETPY